MKPSRVIFAYQQTNSKDLKSTKKTLLTATATVYGVPAHSPNENFQACWSLPIRFAKKADTSEASCKSAGSDSSHRDSQGPSAVMPANMACPAEATGWRRDLCHRVFYKFTRIARMLVLKASVLPLLTLWPLPQWASFHFSHLSICLSTSHCLIKP